MHDIIRNVRDIAEADRLALEHLIGAPLRENQQVAVHVTDIEGLQQTVAESPPHDELAIPDWWNIYAGLTEDHANQLADAVRQRANLSRSFE